VVLVLSPVGEQVSLVLLHLVLDTTQEICRIHAALRQIFRNEERSDSVIEERSRFVTCRRRIILDEFQPDRNVVYSEVKHIGQQGLFGLMRGIDICSQVVLSLISRGETMIVERHSVGWPMESHLLVVEWCAVFGAKSPSCCRCCEEGH